MAAWIRHSLTKASACPRECMWVLREHTTSGDCKAECLHMIPGLRWTREELEGDESSWRLHRERGAKTSSVSPLLPTAFSG